MRAFCAWSGFAPWQAIAIGAGLAIGTAIVAYGVGLNQGLSSYDGPSVIQQANPSYPLGGRKKYSDISKIFPWEI